MNKPTKPTNLMPRFFGGVKNNWSSSMQSSGYEDGIPAIYGGDNLNYQLDATGKELDYCEKIVDFINEIPIGKTITVDANNNLIYGDLVQDIPIATTESVGVVKPDGETITIETDGTISARFIDRYLVSAHIDGSTWYRLYSDGWKEQGGYIATSASEMEWGQPYLSSDGVLGGNAFAVSASSENRPAYEAFDGNGGSTVSSNGWASSVPPAYLIFYNPTPLKVSGLDITNRMGGSGTYPSVIRAGALYGSNTNSDYELIASFTSSAGRGQTFQVDMNSTNFYKYHKLQITQTAPTRDGGTTNVMIREVKIHATYQGVGGNGVVFPISFSNTNYTFSLGFEGVSGSNIYVSSKTTTGFQLSSTASGQVAWYACGY